MADLITAKSILIAVLALHAPSEVTEEQAYCMAMNVYHEARSEPVAGQVQVAHATMARVHDQRYPNNVCDVVLSSRKDSMGVPKKYMCAFSWFCDGKSDDINFYTKKGKLIKLDVKNFTDAAVISVAVMDGKVPDICDGANFYYNPKAADPKWARYYIKQCTIGDHVFMKREFGSLK